MVPRLCPRRPFKNRGGIMYFWVGHTKIDQPNKFHTNLLIHTTRFAEQQQGKDTGTDESELQQICGLCALDRTQSKNGRKGERIQAE